ncbi:MAG: Spy/CpxP family protein refolding chaperone [Candidatus Omnitrophota bacterium]
MKIRIKLIVFMAGVFILSSLGTSYAQNGRGQSDSPPQGKHKQMFEKMKEELNLTPEQVKVIEEYRKANQAAGKENRQQMMQKQEALRAEIEKDTLDMAAINKIHSEIKELSAAREDQRLSQILKMREVLTPEQRSLMQEHMKGRMKGQGKGNGNGKGMGKGRGKPEVFTKIQQELSLTDEQAAKMMEIFKEEHQKRMEDRGPMGGPGSNEEMPE